MKLPLFYSTGEEIREGDRIVDEDERPGVIDTVYAPGSPEAKEMDLPLGGVTIAAKRDGRIDYTLVPPKIRSFTDMVFVGRARQSPEKELSDFIQSPKDDDLDRWKMAIR